MLLAWPRKWLGSSGLGMGMEMAEEVWNESASKMLQLPREVRKGWSMTPVVLKAAGTPLLQKPALLFALPQNHLWQEAFMLIHCRTQSVLLKFGFAYFPCDIRQGRGQLHSVPSSVLSSVRTAHESNHTGVCSACLSCLSMQSAVPTLQEYCARWVSPPACFRVQITFGVKVQGFRSSAYSKPSQILLILLLWSDAWRNWESGRSSFSFLFSLNHLIQLQNTLLPLWDSIMAWGVYICLDLGFGLRLWVFFCFIFSCNWEIASRFLILKNTCSLLLCMEQCAAFKAAPQTIFFAWSLHRISYYHSGSEQRTENIFFSLFKRKTELFWQLVRNNPAGGSRYNTEINSNLYFDSFNFEIVSYFLQAGEWTLPTAPRLLERIESIWFYQPLAW